MLVIADASPLILLDRLGHLSLLPDLYGQVVVPRAVLEEIAAGAEKAGLAEMESAEWIEVAELPEDRTLLAALLDELGAGEAAAIALARSRDADLVLIDERQGRRIARRIGLVVKGTLGVLIEARRRELIPELEPLLKRLRDEGAWVADSLIEEALRSVGEDPRAQDE